MNSTYCLRFPSVLKQALQSGEIAFGEGVEFEYEPITVYRGISREETESKEVALKDFYSYAELGKKPRGVVDPASLYSCSCYRAIDQLKLAMHLPRPNKYIVQGVLREHYGPQKTKKDTGHVDWWRYEEADFLKEFRVI